MLIEDIKYNLDILFLGCIAVITANNEYLFRGPLCQFEFLCSVKEDKKTHVSWNARRTKGALRGSVSHFWCASAALQSWTSRRKTVFHY